MTRLAPHLASRASLVTVLVAALAGCAVVGAVEPEPTAEPEPAASASPTPTAAPASFTAPDTCAELVGPALDAEFSANGVDLFSGSDGTGIYTLEAPLGQDGGDPLYCLYGQDGVDLSTFEFAAQGLTNDAHEGVIAELATRGLDEQADGERVTFSQEGDEGSSPAIVHIVLPDGWVTVYSTFGGPDRFAEATGWAETARGQVYPAP